MNTKEAVNTKDQKRCFVVMGFGVKTDLATGRKLNLDKSYQALIKPVVESKGIICVRADEIKHSGTIDVPMFQQLFTADIVVADLSTSNVNAFYELGIRHALRPRTTIIMSEEQFNYPFDVNHIIINKYTHLGDSIDYFEVMRFQKLLGETLDLVLNDEKPDSPVYTFLDNLIPPSLKDKAEKVAQKMEEALANAQDKEDNKSGDNQTLALLIKQAEDAVKNKQYDLAKSLFHSALLMSDCDIEQKVISNNTYLVQRLAFATYKAKHPDEVTALKDAIKLLSKIDLEHTNDSETVTLAGAIEKLLFELGQGEEHVNYAILYFQRGFFLLHNRYNGTNLAYLLNARANTSLDATEEEKIADMVWANRIRKEVLIMCKNEWNEIINRKSKQNRLLQNDVISQSQEATEKEQSFWILVNKAEAQYGLGQFEEYNKTIEEVRSIEYEGWMMKSFEDQLAKLKQVLQNTGHLINPQWKEPDRQMF
jgi:hypothetical protein